MRAALTFLQRAQKPVIVAGGGVRSSGAARELVALAEKLQIPVATSLNGKDSIPGTHPLSVGVVGSYSRESANRTVAAADLVCFVGTETGGMTTHFWAVPPIGTPAIQIDLDPEALGRNYPLLAAVNGDAKVTLARMLAAADRSTAGKRDAWINPEKVNTLKEIAARHNLPVEVVSYDADHAFFNDTRPQVYNAEAAADAWRRVLEHFRKRLAG